jgi:MoaA/NifB/PqqE/SkfB family radical SAM enzyme
MNSNYCVLPFVHSCTNVGGRNKPCCRFSDQTYNDNISPLDYFNGEKLNLLREKMLRGEKIKGCNKCFSEEALGKESYRQRSNKQYKGYIGKSPKLKFIEIGLSNACNFGCVTCDAAYSTTWWNDIDDVNKVGANKAKPNNKVVYTDIEINDFSDVDRIKILGGEPFMEPRNLEFLKKCNLENVELELVTNGSILPNKEWQDVLSSLKYINLDISLDGHGETAEFVRYGTNWNKLQSNIEWWKNWWSNHNNITIKSHYVVHALNIFDLNNYLKWQKEFGWKTTFDILQLPEYLNIKILPKFLKQELLNELDIPNITQYLQNNLEIFDIEQCNRLINYVNVLNKKRNHDVSYINNLMERINEATYK